MASVLGSAMGILGGVAGATSGISTDIKTYNNEKKAEVLDRQADISKAWSEVQGERAEKASVKKTYLENKQKHLQSEGLDLIANIAKTRINGGNVSSKAVKYLKALDANDKNWDETTNDLKITTNNQKKLAKESEQFSNAAHQLKEDSRALAGRNFDMGVYMYAQALAQKESDTKNEQEERFRQQLAEMKENTKRINRR